MMMQKGYNIDGHHSLMVQTFSYWKGRIEYYLMTIIEKWFNIRKGFEMPMDEFRKWTNEIKRKE